PLGLDLAAGDAPDLLGVRAEERVIETLAEVRRHPVLEARRLRGRAQSAPEVGERAAGGLDGAEAAEDVLRDERVREELALVVDAREPRPDEQLVAEHLVPEPLDRLQL